MQEFPIYQWKKYTWPFSKNSLSTHEKNGPFENCDLPIEDGDVHIDDDKISIEDVHFPVEDGDFRIGSGHFPIEDGEFGREKVPTTPTFLLEDFCFPSPASKVKKPSKLRFIVNTGLITTPSSNCQSPFRWQVFFGVFMK